MPRSLSPWSFIEILPLAGFTAVALVVASTLARVDAARAEAEEGRRRFSFLVEASDALAASLDYETRLREVAGLAVPRLADWCAIHLVDERFGTAMRSVASSAGPNVPGDVARALERRAPIPPSAARGGGNVLRTGVPELYPEVTDGLLFEWAEDPASLEVLRAAHLLSAIVVPVTARGRTLGALSLVTAARSGRRYAQPDLEVVEELARRAGLAIDNARLFTERAHAAETLQRSLLPPDLPDVSGVDLAEHYRPAREGHEVGGDFYDIWEVDEGNWLLAIGDVVGKGLEAAAVTGIARHTLRAVAVRLRSPARMLLELNRALLSEGAPERFLTVALVRLTATGKGVALTAAVAGHPVPAVLRRSGAIDRLGVEGTLLGVVADPLIEDVAGELKRGDALILYTDGLVGKDEADCFARGSGLEDVVRACAAQPAEEIVAAITDYAEARTTLDPQDDVAVVVVRAR